MEAIVTSAVAQLGAVGLLIAFMFWSLRNKNRECKEERDTHEMSLKSERDRNAALTERIITLAQTQERTTAEMAAAVRALHP